MLTGFRTFFSHSQENAGKVC